MYYAKIQTVLWKAKEFKTRFELTLLGNDGFDSHLSDVEVESILLIDVTGLQLLYLL